MTIRERIRAFRKALSPQCSYQATLYGIHGLSYAFRSDSSFIRLVVTELIVAFVVLYALWIPTLLEIIIVIIASSLPLISETLNVAIEEVVDLVSPEKNEKAKYAKDCAAGATLIATCVWFSVLGLVILRHYS